GIWVVPKYSNPTGVVFSDAVVERMAALGRIAAKNFRLFWDNAYAVHDLHDNPPVLANIMDYCERFGTGDSVLQFTSTSKISFAGAGVAFLAASAGNLAKFKKHLGIATIGPDKVNQLRHARMFPDLRALKDRMQQHAELLRPKFAAVLRSLEENIKDGDLGRWQVPLGGYFVSFDARPGVASEVVRLAGAAGVKLTPAGATFPYGRDPEDRNIRLAPSLPVLEEVEKTMAVFVTCVKLASVRKQLKGFNA
ncbi:MAG TPA: aminotransferase class I/II-fold pyridoxal phosphate-dependent enzyme, partial [Gammaproteobacteria bacterium]|nr:aminotransferase class I/II-fold pyridoxal phosphate-dependent enzyme [Gammaproteobacteria bacterium]